MEIPYRQLSLEEALRVYADWLAEQFADPRMCSEWYVVFYPLRTLMLADRLLGRHDYMDLVVRYLDIYVSQQLPNGGFTSNQREKPTSEMTKREFHDTLRSGKVNLADNGSNVTALIQAAMALSDERRGRYMEAAHKWFDEWVPIWALPDGGYGNGIWQGHKLNSPYTCAISTVAVALSAFTLATGEPEYVENAERCITFQCGQWLPDGRPIFLDCYPRPRKCALNDYSHSFYLLEGMCWTHSASKNDEARALIEKRLKEWIFGKEGLLSQWLDSWFNFQFIAYPPEADGELPMSRLWLRPGWELAKSNGIVHAFLYYLNHIDNDARLREKVELGLKFLSNPLKARHSGVAADTDESYGMFAEQAAGFAGLSLAEGIRKDSVFSLE